MEPASRPSPRARLTRAERRSQLESMAWEIVREEGSDALTLGHLAARAGVTKPVVYDHFGTRNGLLAALYSAYDSRQNMIVDAKIQAGGPGLAGKAAAIASAYVDCVLRQGSEIADVLAALAGSPELEATKRTYLLAFMEKCRAILLPYAKGRAIAPAGLWAMLGAAEALSKAAAVGDIAPEQAKAELERLIIAMVERGAGPKEA